MNILLLSTLLQCDHLFRVKSAREYGNYVIQLNCVTKEMMQQCHFNYYLLLLCWSKSFFAQFFVASSPRLWWWVSEWMTLKKKCACQQQLRNSVIRVFSQPGAVLLLCYSYQGFRWLTLLCVVAYLWLSTTGRYGTLSWNPIAYYTSAGFLWCCCTLLSLLGAFLCQFKVVGSAEDSEKPTDIALLSHTISQCHVISQPARQTRRDGGWADDGGWGDLGSRKQFYVMQF